MKKILALFILSLSVVLQASYLPLNSLDTGNDQKINYVLNYGAEATTNGYATYADTAGLSPVDGTGGSPNVTFTRNQTTPLLGTSDFVLTKDAANRQGEGASYDFTIDSAQKSKVQTVSFYYSTSANFDYGTAGDASDPSDVVVYVYDVTNTEVIQLVPYTLDGSGKFTGTFQASSDSTSYRLIFHIAGTNASAWTMNIDNIVVGPQSVAKGSIDVYLGELTTTGSWTTNTTYTGKYWRVGDRLKGRVQLDLAGAPNSTTLSITLPNGYTIDTDKLTQSTSGRDDLGDSWLFNNGTAQITGEVGLNGSTSVRVRYKQVSGSDVTTQSVSDTGPFTWASGDSLIVVYEVPVQGWGSNTILSTDSGNRVVAFKMLKTSGTQSITQAGGETKVTFDSTKIEKGATVDLSNERITIQESGTYFLKSVFDTVNSATSGITITAYFKVNGGSQKYGYYINSDIAASTRVQTPVTDIIELNAGDYIEVYFELFGSSTSVTIQNSSTLDKSFFEGFKIQTPQTIGQSELVSATFSSDAGQSIPDSTVTILDFEDVSNDTHGAIATGASWKFTAPYAGKYTASVFIQLNSDNNWEANEQMRVMLYKNGSEEKRIDLKSMAATLTSYTMTVGGSASIDLVAGDEINFRVLQNSDAAISINNGSSALAHGSIVKQ